jgi:hypothetical protein
MYMHRRANQLKKIWSTLYVNSYFRFLCYSVILIQLKNKFLKACVTFCIFDMTPHKVKRLLLLDSVYHLCCGKCEFIMIRDFLFSFIKNLLAIEYLYHYMNQCVRNTMVHQTLFMKQRS